MVPLATRVLAIASAGDRRISWSQLSTGVGMSTVEAPWRGGLSATIKEGRALRWIRVVKMALIRFEVLQHLLSRPFRRIMVRSAESVKHVNSVPRMVAACVVIAQRRPSVSRNTCGKARFRLEGRKTRS